MARRFEGKTVLVTGSARGQGACEARLFAAEGASVLLCDVLDDIAGDVVRGIQSDGGHALYLHLDVADEDSWKAVRDYVASKLHSLHVLVNNAAIAHRSALMSTEVRNWDRVLAVNLRGPFLGIQALAPLIRDSGGGAIVNIGSIAGVTGHFAAAYSASKWGLRGLTKAAALELVDWRIRVNAVHPGVVDTPIVAGSKKFVDAMVAMTPMRRIASAEEIAAVVLFMASDDASFVTGVDIDVDGGFAATAAYRKVAEMASA